jgi:hypothetical protein
MFAGYAPRSIGIHENEFIAFSGLPENLIPFRVLLKLNTRTVLGPYQRWNNCCTNQKKIFKTGHAEKVSGNCTKSAVLIK